LVERDAKIASLEKAVANLKGKEAPSREEAILTAEKKKLEDKVAKLRAKLSDGLKREAQLNEQVLKLGNEIEQWAAKEQKLKSREEQIALKLKDARRTRVNENDLVRLNDDLKRLQLAVDEDREALAEKDILLQSRESELDELREKVATIEILSSQLQKISEENRDFREKLKTLQYENTCLDAEVKQTRGLEVEVEFLKRKLENQQKRILREYPQTEKITRRRRSVSASEVEPKSAMSTRRRLRMGNEENSILDKPLDRPIRDTSPVATPCRTRSVKKR